MVVPALEIIAYTNQPQQQIIGVNRGNRFEYFGAYTPLAGSTSEQTDSILMEVIRFLETEEISHKHIVAARIYAATKEDLDTFLDAQKEIFGKEIPPQTTLHTKPCEPEARIAYQFEIIEPNNCNFPIEDVYDRLGNRVGTLVKQGERKDIYLRGIFGRDKTGISGDIRAQAMRMYEQQLELLQQYGFTYRNVARAHIYIARMGSDYGGFNHERNAFFDRVGITERFPASTGIGIPTFPDSALCVSDILAQQGVNIQVFPSLIQDETITYEGLPFKVRFSRLSESDKERASGHASILGTKSAHVNCFELQLRQTFVNGEVLLIPRGANLDDAVSHTVYIKDPNNYDLFLQERKKWMRFPMPTVVVRADVCRAELLYEHELEALPAEKRAVLTDGRFSFFDRRKPILDLNYVPPNVEKKPEFRALMNGADVIPRR